MDDREYMLRAIELAKKGYGFVNPNPLVGAVIVKDGKIIGEGYHTCYGKLHAEREALAHVTEETKGATIYVTLEPCCHHGKQPPCTQALIDAGISKVVVGSNDPNPVVSGGGVKALREHGIEVVTEFMKEECDAINDIFFHYITTGLPYVTLKYAMTLDGKIATKTGDSKWITGEQARARVQEERNGHMAIMAGIGTVLADDPMLTVRIPSSREIIRVIVDSKLRIPVESQIVKTAKEHPTIVACAIEAGVDNGHSVEKLCKLEEAGVSVVRLPDENGMVDIKSLMRYLGQKKIDSVYLEGGGTLSASALKAGIVNEVHTYIGPKVFGGQDAKGPIGGAGVEQVGDAVMLTCESVEQVGEDVLLVYKKSSSH